MIKKGLAVAVILLFIGVAFAPTINSSVVKDELVEFDVEFSGLDKKHTVKLTQQEADEVGSLFDDIEQRLSEVETRDEAEEIFKDAVVQLDEYGLLGNLKIGDITKVITRSSIKLFDRHSNSDYTNRYCLIYLNTGNTSILPIDINICLCLALLIYFISNNLDLSLIEYLANEASLYSQIKLFRLINYLIVSNFDVENSFNVYSLGLYGFKKSTVEYGEGYAMMGFSGLIIKTNWELGTYAPINAYYLGSAIWILHED